MSENLFVENDGLPCPVVGSWAETKYRLLALYDELFSMGMKYKWDQRVYIDLYAGAGYARVKGTKKGSEQETVRAYPFIEFGSEPVPVAALESGKSSPGPQCFRTVERC